VNSAKRAATRKRVKPSQVWFDFLAGSAKMRPCSTMSAPWLIVGPSA